MTIRNENSYRGLEQILLEVNRDFVRMDYRKHQCVETCKIVVEALLEHLKERNSVFGKIFSRLAYVGSYYDGLRVKEATEFDLNIIVKLPLRYDKIKVLTTHSVAGYARIDISEAMDYVKFVDPVKRVVDSWCDKDGYLQQSQVRFWLEGVLTKSLGHGRFNVEGFECQLRKCGPAFTLSIFLENTRIDVDLVFTLEFNQDVQPPSSIKWPPRFVAPWVVVPKPLEHHYNKNVMWRMSFSRSEQLIMYNMGKLKLINRFLKALRDSQKLNICSYYIKTVFLWEADKVHLNGTPKTFWTKNTGYLFIYALQRLQEYLENKRLPYYWHKGCNLFGNLSPSNLDNMACRLKNIIKSIHKCIDDNDKEKLRNLVFNLFEGKETTNSFVFLTQDDDCIDLPQPEESSSFCSLQ